MAAMPELVRSCGKAAILPGLYKNGQFIVILELIR